MSGQRNRTVVSFEELDGIPKYRVKIGEREFRSVNSLDDFDAIFFIQLKTELSNEHAQLRNSRHAAQKEEALILDELRVEISSLPERLRYFIYGIRARRLTLGMDPRTDETRKDLPITDDFLKLTMNKKPNQTGACSLNVPQYEQSISIFFNLVPYIGILDLSPLFQSLRDGSTNLKLLTMHVDARCRSSLLTSMGVTEDAGGNIHAAVGVQMFVEPTGKTFETGKERKKVHEARLIWVYSNNLRMRIVSKDDSIGRESLYVDYQRNPDLYFDKTKRRLIPFPH